MAETWRVLDEDPTVGGDDAARRVSSDVGDGPLTTCFRSDRGRLRAGRTRKRVDGAAGA